MKTNTTNNAMRRRATRLARAACTGLFTALLALSTANTVLAAPASTAAHNHELSPQTNSSDSTRVEELSLALPQLNAQYRAAPAELRAERLDALIAIAAERQARFAKLIETDPAAALRMAVPAKIRTGMPARVQSYLEQRVDLEGELELRYQDYPSGKGLLRHDLLSAQGRSSLHFAGNAPMEQSGTRVRIRGVRLGNRVAVQPDDGVLILALASTGGTVTSTTGTAIATNTFGEQRTVVLMVNFAANPSEPWTAAAVRDTVFGKVSDYIRENSYGQTWVAGDVFGWFTLAVDPSTCNTMDISIAAQQAAKAKGIDLTGYQRIVYAFPDIGCPWSGEATVGGSPSHAWFDGTVTNAGVVAHELGHNLGLYHSHSMDCDSVSAGDNCWITTYGDPIDRMGGAPDGHFNAFQKQRLGWLGYGVSPAIQTIDASGVYQLEPFSAQTGGIKAIRVPRDIDPLTGQQRWFYLEFRQPVGFDSFLSTSDYGPNVTNGVVFHMGTENGPDSSYILDATPNSRTSFDFLDLALVAGATFTDSVAGVTVTTDFADPTGATVTINFGASQCMHAKPSLSISPAQGPWVVAGTPVSFSVTVTNNDSADCGNATFDLAGTVPAGWTSSFTSSSLTLAPGAKAVTAITATSALNAADGFYDVLTTATNRTNPSFANSGKATYVVSAAAANLAPIAVNDSASTLVSTPVAINVIANDKDPEGKPLTVTAVTQPARGSVTIGTGGSVTYVPANRFKGTDTFQYTVSDGQSSASATVTVTVAADTSTGGGKGGGAKK